MLHQSYPTLSLCLSLHSCSPSASVSSFLSITLSLFLSLSLSPSHSFSISISPSLSLSPPLTLSISLSLSLHLSLCFSLPLSHSHSLTLSLPLLLSLYVFHFQIGALANVGLATSKGLIGYSVNSTGRYIGFVCVLSNSIQFQDSWCYTVSYHTASCLVVSSKRNHFFESYRDNHDESFCNQFYGS